MAVAARTFNARLGKVNRQTMTKPNIGEIEVVALVREIYARLCNLEIVGKATDMPHKVVMAKFWRAVKPVYPAEAWKEHGPLVEAALLAIRKTSFITRHPVKAKSAPLSKPIIPIIPKITVSPLKDEPNGARYSITCHCCGPIRDTFTRARGEVERTAHAAEHRREPLLGYAYKSTSSEQLGTKKQVTRATPARFYLAGLSCNIARCILQYGLRFSNKFFEDIPISIILDWLETHYHQIGMGYGKIAVKIGMISPQNILPTMPIGGLI